MPKRRNPTEIILQEYLIKNNGYNLKKIEDDLIFKESERVFKNGRIDIIAEQRVIFGKNKPIGIELKTNKYNTADVCDQLDRYIHFMSKKGGIVYFIAPKIKEGVADNLVKPYRKNQVQFYEVSIHNMRSMTQYEFKFQRVTKDDLDDSRKIVYLDDILKPHATIYKTQKEKKERKKKIINLFKAGKDLYDQFKK